MKLVIFTDNIFIVFLWSAETIRLLQLFNWALEPADDDVLDELFDLGYRDANTWTDQNPVEDIVKPNMVVEIL